MWALDERGQADLLLERWRARPGLRQAAFDQALAAMMAADDGLAADSDALKWDIAELCPGLFADLRAQGVSPEVAAETREDALDDAWGAEVGYGDAADAFQQNAEARDY